MKELESLDTSPKIEGSLGSALRGFACRVQSGIESHPWLAFALFSTFYFVIVFLQSSMKLLWLDELITLHIARLGSIPAIWHALGRGVDPNPPLMYLLVHWSIGLFGNHEFAYRMPAAIGYWAGLFSLFLYLRRLLPVAWALPGTVLSTTMAAFEYSYESRSYAVLYGMAMVAVLCWSWTADRATPRWDRWLSLGGMALALAVGISVNYFAVLAFLPIAAGEAARTWRHADTLRRGHGVETGVRRFWQALNLRVWIALLVAACPLLLYRPLIEHSIAEFAPYAWNKVSWGQVSDSYTEMVEMMLYPALALFALAIGLRLLSPRIQRICAACQAGLLPAWVVRLAAHSRDRLAIPFHEGVAVFCLIAYPILGYLIASIRGGMLSPRFVIPVCFGFAIAVTLLAFQLFRQFRPAPAAMLCLVLAWLICRESYMGYWYEEQKQCFYKVIDRLPQAEAAAPPGSPIVVPDPLMVLTFRHYAPADVAARVVLPLDFPAIRFFRHDDSPEENLWAGRNLIYGLRIVPLADFQNSAGKYLILASDGNWFLDDLLVHRFPFYRLDINTRAVAIGGFTPLAHGVPAFYIGFGGTTPESVIRALDRPVPFEAAENLPRANTYAIPQRME
jgi:drug/metabolite transporter superfamily protein YnfA